MFKRFRANLFGQPAAEPDSSSEQPASPPPEPSEASEPRAAPTPDAAATAVAGARAVSARTHGGAQPPGAAPVRGPSAAPGDDTASAAGDDLAASADDADETMTDERGAHRPGGFLRNRFRFSLGRTRQLFGQMGTTLAAADEITPGLWDELEETLITSDVGVQTTERLLATLHQRMAAEHLEHGSQLRDALKDELGILLGEPDPLVFSETTPVTVVLVVGVNGVGKTTSIAKLAYQLKRQRHRVMLAAGDTFRAAATEQLKLWGERVGVPVISHQHGADPGAVAFDAMQAAQARRADVLIVDTAGRLHTKYNLMQELKKIVSVLQKYDAEAPHEVLLVIDATTGQNGFLQARQFVQDTGVSGVILTKLDGTARGGIAFAVASELGVPIKYVGTGERVQDFAPFDPREFVDALFDAA